MTPWASSRCIWARFDRVGFRPVLPCTPLSFDCVLLLTTCTVLLWDISKNTGAYSYDSYMHSLYATTVSLNNIARESDSSYSRSTFGIADLERVLECVQTTGTVLVVTLIRTLEYVLHLFLCCAVPWQFSRSRRKASCGNRSGAGLWRDMSGFSCCGNEHERSTLWQPTQDGALAGGEICFASVLSHYSWYYWQSLSWCSSWLSQTQLVSGKGIKKVKGDRLHMGVPFIIFEDDPHFLVSIQQPQCFVSTSSRSVALWIRILRIKVRFFPYTRYTI